MYMRIGAKPNPEAWMNTTPRRLLDSIRASVMAMGKRGHGACSMNMRP